MAELVVGALELAAAITQRLKSHVQPDFVAVFEAVGHRLGRAVDLHRDPLDDVFFDAGGQRRAGKADDAEWRVVRPRSPRFLADGQPHLERRLGDQLVKAQG